MSLLDDASLIVTPNAYKEGKLYSVIPSNGNGDFSVTRATTATRVNAAGLVESVAIGQPRLDYSLGSCPNILLEPQRTNLVLRSEEFDNAVWAKLNSTTTANVTTSPSGIVNADTLTDNATSGIHVISQSGGSVGVYTFTFYAKANTLTRVGLLTGATTNVALASTAQVFDLSNGTVVNTISGVTATITNVGNGWYRCSTTLTSLASGAYFITCIKTGTNIAYIGSGESLFIWGAQLEAGAYPTSYIPTSSASVTRNIDVVQKTGVSSLIGQTEGTIYWEGTLTDGQGYDIFYLNASTTNSVFIYKNAVNVILFRVYYGGSSIIIPTPTSYTGTIKIAASYKSGDSVLYINGVQIGTSATAFAFTGALNDVVLSNTAYLFGNATKNIKTAALFPTRLTNAQLAALTTL